MTPRQTGQRTSTATRILDAAERVVQSKGFGCFSYADVASELKITKAAMHYHYPGKAELGEALIARYSARFAGALTALDAAGGSALAKLEGYIDLYADVLSQQKMCLCGMLAAEYDTLPAPMQAEVVRFFDQNEDWLERVLEQGRSEGTIRFGRSARDAALMIISALEGALLVTRPYGDPKKFRSTAEAMLSGLYTTREPVMPPERIEPSPVRRAARTDAIDQVR